MYTYTYIFIYSSVHRHIGCFHILAVTNSVAMNFGIHVSFWIGVFAFIVYIPRSRIAGLVALLLVFWGPSSGCTSLYSHHQLYEHYVFSTSSSTFVTYRLFDASHSDRCEVITHCSFDLHFSREAWRAAIHGVAKSQTRLSDWSDLIWWLAMLSIFLCAYWHLYIFFWKMSIWVLCPFLIGSFLYWVIWPVYAFWIFTPYQSYCLYFLPFHSCLFSFCWWSPCCEKADTFKFLVVQVCHMSSQLCKEVIVAALYFMEGTGAQRSCCCCSVTQSRLTFCNPMDCSTPGFLVLHHLPELAQTHVHWVIGAIQPSCSLLIPSPPAFNLS